MLESRKYLNLSIFVYHKSFFIKECLFFLTPSKKLNKLTMAVLVLLQSIEKKICQLIYLCSLKSKSQTD